MKIEDLLTQIITPKTPEAKPAAGEANFAQQLQEVLAAQVTGAPEAPAALGNLSAVAPVTEVNRTPGEVLDTVLSHLDKYRQALASSDLPLKKIAALVETLEQDSQRLQALAQALPASSPLKSVMEEAAALAYTESFKFNRGDYV
ncbi:MAG: hypothetical protein AB1424_13040 [Thermodesulfobacteriota bacterium]